MTAHALASHMERPLGRGHTPEDAHTGAAWRSRLRRSDPCLADVDPDSADGRDRSTPALTPAAAGPTIAAGSATVSMIRGAGLLDAARIGAAEIAAGARRLSPAKRHAAELAADALHRALGGGAARAPRCCAAQPTRTLVAMSGGVDSAVAALLVARRGAETVGVTLELWSDPENDGEQSCCSAQAVRGARELAHGLGMAHLSIDLRAEFRAGVVDPWLPTTPPA